MALVLALVLALGLALGLPVLVRDLVRDPPELGLPLVPVQVPGLLPVLLSAPGLTSVLPLGLVQDHFPLVSLSSCPILCLVQAKILLSTLELMQDSIQTLVPMPGLGLAPLEALVDFPTLTHPVVLAAQEPRFPVVSVAQAPVQASS